MRVLVTCGLSSVLLACAGSSREPTRLDPNADGGTDATADAPRQLCVDGKSADGIYPKGPYGYPLFSTIPDVTFDGFGADGTKRTLALHEMFEPCAERSRILLLRVTTAWCGPCRWDSEHTKELLASDIADRIALIEVLVRNEDNVPASVDDAASWRSKVSSPIPVVIDPTFRLGATRIGRAVLPSYVLVDTRTMRVLNELDAPAPAYLLGRIREELAALDGTAKPSPPDEPMVDGFDRRSWDLLQAMKVPDVPPPDPTNAKADDPLAAKLGSDLFADKGLSPSGTVSCTTCHDPAASFADGKPQAIGVAAGDRNTPSIVLASHARWQFWDGRADSLWAQALGPFENDKEFASSRLFVAHVVFDRYKAAYEAVFGPLPPLGDTTRFPAAGKPGDATWTAMSAADRDAVSRVFSNAGKAIAAFERTLRIGPNGFDAYLAGDKAALTDGERTGLQTFFSAGCIQCHWGPRLTDDAFHAVRFPTGRADGKGDGGRKLGIASLLTSEFRADGPFSDAPSAAHGLSGLVAGEWTLGAFKTPPLRGVTLTAPYGHGGTLTTMQDVLKNYSTAGLKADDPRAVGTSEPWLPEFSSNHADDLMPFMRLLGGPPR